MASRNYQDLIVWKKAMDLVEKVYRVSILFPREELYGLVSQIRRASVSIPSNIAEGQGRATKKDFSHFLHMSYGSLREVETQIMIAGRLNYAANADVEEVLNLAGEVGRLLVGLIKSLQD